MNINLFFFSFFLFPSLSSAAKKKALSPSVALSFSLLSRLEAPFFSVFGKYLDSPPLFLGVSKYCTGVYERKGYQEGKKCH